MNRKKLRTIGAGKQLLNTCLVTQRTDIILNLLDENKFLFFESGQSHLLLYQTYKVSKKAEKYFSLQHIY